MGGVNFFLATTFTWVHHDDSHISVHLSQYVFTKFMRHRFSVGEINLVPIMTLYYSGYLIDSIPAADPNDPDLKQHMKVYQCIIGSINWLVQYTHPDLAPVLTFLATYNIAHNHQYYKAALHILKCLISISEYDIFYHSDSCNTPQAFNHFPHHHNEEAYSNATPSYPSEYHQLTAFSFQ